MTVIYENKEDGRFSADVEACKVMGESPIAHYILDKVARSRVSEDQTPFTPFHWNERDVAEVKE